MIPIWDKVKSKKKPFILWAILLLNIAVFIYELDLDGFSLVIFFYKYGLVPEFVANAARWHAEPLKQIIPFFSSMFVHAGWMHLLGNLWFLFVFGDNVEDRMGHKRFIFFYIMCGWASMLVHVVTNWGTAVPTVGASGAIAGVMGAYLMYYPRARVLMSFPIFIIFPLITVPAYFFLVAWIGMQFFYGVGQLLESGAGAGIAWWAHIGGFMFGAITANLWQKKPVMPIDINIRFRKTSGKRQKA